MDDLIDITDYLVKLDKTHIYHLGLVLGLNLPRVKGMKDSETFLDDVISAWLQKVDQVEKRGTPTWQRMVEALRHHRVGQNGIANEIEQEHAQGTTRYNNRLVGLPSRLLLHMWCFSSVTRKKKKKRNEM